MNSSSSSSSFGNRGPSSKLSASVSERLGPRRNFAATNFDDIGSSSNALQTSSSAATVNTNGGSSNINTASYRKPNRNLIAWPNDIFNLDSTQEKWWLVEPLRCIDLSFNQIPLVPNQIHQFFESLVELRLASNLLTVLPDTITELINLRILDVSKNKLSSLPDNLGNCTNLVELNVSSNHLTTVSVWGTSSTSTPPPTASSLVRLEICNLADNRIAILPDPFFNGMKSLRTVNLSNNPLNKLPSSLSTPSHLHTLNISRCQLTRIPRNYLVALQELEFLDARQNMLEELPILPNTDKSIISEVYFGFNRIVRIEPECLVRSSLTVIDIADNQIKDIPDELRNCIKLMTFDISNNDINTLPAWLGFLPALVRIVLEGNPLRSMKRTFLGAHVNIGALKQYLKTRATPEEAILWEREIQAGGCVKFALQYPNASGSGVSSSSGNSVPFSSMSMSSAPDTLSIGYSNSGSSSASLVPQSTHTVRPTSMHSSTVTIQSATETAKSLDYTDHFNNGWEHALREVLNTNGKLILSKDFFPGRLTTITGQEFSKWTKTGINILTKITSFIGDYQSFGGTGLPLDLCTKLLPNLGEVSLMYNSLTRIPRALTSDCLSTISNGYCNLHTLKLANNQLNSVDWLPSSVTYIDLRYNNFTTVPNTLWTLPKLYTLLLGNNRISIHTPSLSSSSSSSSSSTPSRLRIHSDDDLLWLPSLRYLDLSNNQFQRLPVSVLGLTNLESLDISHNELPNIPVHLGTLSRLTGLNIDNNPQRSIRYNVLEKGTNHLLNYLKSRIPEGEEYIYIEAYRNVLPGGVHNTSGRINPNNNYGDGSSDNNNTVPPSSHPPSLQPRYNTNTNYENNNPNTYTQPLVHPNHTVPQHTTSSTPNHGGYSSSSSYINNVHGPSTSRSTNGHASMASMGISSAYNSSSLSFNSVPQHGGMYTPVFQHYPVVNSIVPSQSYPISSTIVTMVGPKNDPPVDSSLLATDPNSHMNIVRRIDAIANELQKGSLSSAQVLIAKREIALLRAAEIRARGSL